MPYPFDDGFEPDERASRPEPVVTDGTTQDGTAEVSQPASIEEAMRRVLDAAFNRSENQRVDTLPSVNINAAGAWPQGPVVVRHAEPASDDVWPLPFALARRAMRDQDEVSLDNLIEHYYDTERGVMQPSLAYARLMNKLVDLGLLMECDRCGHYEVKSLVQDVTLQQGSQEWCRECVDNFASECSSCNEITSTSSMLTDHDDNRICRSCASEFYSRCRNCERLFRTYSDEWMEGRDGYCLGCVEDMDPDYDDDDDYGTGIRDYSTDILNVLDCTMRKGVRYFGAEIELECEGSRSAVSQPVLDIVRHEAILKSDGSLSNGFEIVTKPMTLQEWQHEPAVLRACRRAVELGATSHNTTSCGLHVHVSRETVTETTVAKLVMFLNDEVNAKFLTRIGRRSMSNTYAAAHKKNWTRGHDALTVDALSRERVRQLFIDKWGITTRVEGSGVLELRTGGRLLRAYSSNPEISFASYEAFLATSSRDLGFESYRVNKPRQHNDGTGRYTPLNLENTSTIEFRFFRGSLDTETVVATIEFCDSLCNWAATASVRDLTSTAYLQWADKHVTRKTYPALSSYMIRRGLRSERVVPEKWVKQNHVNRGERETVLA